VANGFNILNVTRGAELAGQAWRAAGPWSRFVGLLGRESLADGEALHIVPCKSVHTHFMRFPIDVLYLDRKHRVVKAVPNMSPFRFSWGTRGAHSVVELPAGAIAATGTTKGDVVRFEEAPSMA
jgi:uncharacterized membrane protein (UPF0127 family)